MKKFIFGVMLLVSLLGIVGCSNPSNSDDLIIGNGNEAVFYRVKNSTTFEITVSYKNKSNDQAAVKIPVDNIYKIPANDVKLDTITGNGQTVDVVYLTFSGSGTNEKTFPFREDTLREGVQITYVDGNYTKGLIEN